MAAMRMQACVLMPPDNHLADRKPIEQIVKPRAEEGAVALLHDHVVPGVDLQFTMELGAARTGNAHLHLAVAHFQKRIAEIGQEFLAHPYDGMPVLSGHLGQDIAVGYEPGSLRRSPRIEEVMEQIDEKQASA